MLAQFLQTRFKIVINIIKLKRRKAVDKLYQFMKVRYGSYTLCSHKCTHRFDEYFLSTSEYNNSDSPKNISGTCSSDITTLYAICKSLIFNYEVFNC
jgi:hypothetical protein